MYGTSQGAIGVINTTSQTLVGNIPLPSGVYPYGIVLNPSGTTAYLTDENLGTVDVVNLGTDNVTEIPLSDGSIGQISIKCFSNIYCT
jgi:DNA-binding beta-propeller fold protein YncE